VEASKHKNCLNCRQALSREDRFCSHCGQKVDENNLQLRAVIKEFFENYISLDFLFGRTLKPFLLRPGFLSQQFISGRRKDYANPFRLYIFTSLLFFFAFTNFMINKKGGTQIIKIDSSGSGQIPEVNAEEKEILRSKVGVEIIEGLGKGRDTSFADAFADLNYKQQKQLLKQLDSNELKRLQILQRPELLNESKEVTNNSFDFSRLKKYRFHPEITDEQLYDSLKTEDAGYFEEMFYRRFIHIYRSDERTFAKYIFGNLSIAMFLFIPLFTLFVFLLYRKQVPFYVAHLIHVIYLQSFVFVLFGMVFLMLWFIPSWQQAAPLMVVLCGLVFFRYFLKSSRQLYQQGSWRILFKNLLLMLIYLLLGISTLFVEIIISFLSF
jgi:hypothetical protein